MSPAALASGRSGLTAAASASACFFAFSCFCSACQAATALSLISASGLGCGGDDLVDVDREDRAVLRVGDAAGVALAGGERGLQDFRRRRTGSVTGLPSGSLPVSSTAATVVSLRPNFCATSAIGRAAGQRVVGLVADLGDPVGRVLQFQLGFDRGLGLLEGLRGGRLDLDDPQDVPAERRLDRVARRVERQFERDIAQLVRDLLAVQEAEIDRLRVLPGDRRRHLLPVLAGGQRRLGFLGLFLGGREDLLDLALLGGLELLLALVVFGPQLVLRDLGGRRQIARRQAGEREAAVFRRPEQVEIGLVELCQLCLARLADIGDRRRPERRRCRRPAFRCDSGRARRPPGGSRRPRR